MCGYGSTIGSFRIAPGQGMTATYEGLAFGLGRSTELLRLLSGALGLPRLTDDREGEDIASLPAFLAGWKTF
jgi:hypothetical protein